MAKPSWKTFSTSKVNMNKEGCEEANSPKIWVGEATISKFIGSSNCFLFIGWRSGFNLATSRNFKENPGSIVFDFAKTQVGC